jgi:hypothetical protein
MWRGFSVSDLLDLDSTTRAFKNTLKTSRLFHVCNVPVVSVTNRVAQ